MFRQLGYSFVVPMRKGRGRSGGSLIEESADDPAVQLAAAVENLDAVVTFMQKEPYVDPLRIVLAGQSRGGFLAVVYGGRSTDRFDFRGFCRSYGLKPQEIARMAGISPAELLLLQKGRLPEGDSRERLQKVLFLFRALDEYVTPNLRLWLRTPNVGFEGATPLEAIEHGQVIWLWQTLVLFGLGEPSDAVLRLFAPAGRRRPLDRFHFQPKD